MVINKEPKAASKAHDVKAQTVVVNIGGAGKKETNTSGGEKTKTAGVGGKVSSKQEDNDSNKAKASAAAFISKKLFEENNNKPSWMNLGLKKNDQ